MWHHAEYRNEELLVLGHDPRRNDCMLVKLSGLPMNEQSELRRIAASRSGQAASRLIPILQRMESPFGTDWFTYLCRKMEQRNSPVFTLPIKEIQDSLDEDQRAIFKGYGKNRSNRGLETLEQAQKFGDDSTLLEDIDEDHPVNRKRGSLPELPSELPRSGLDSNLGYKMDMMLETLVDESRRTQQLLGKLIGALTTDTQEDKPEEVAPKPRAPRKRHHRGTQAEANA